MPQILRTTAVALLVLGIAATIHEARAQTDGQGAGSQGPGQGRGGALRQACRADFQRLCQGTQPGGGRILACLKDHDAELSPDCKQALAAAPGK